MGRESNSNSSGCDGSNGGDASKNRQRRGQGKVKTSEEKGDVLDEGEKGAEKAEGKEGKRQGEEKEEDNWVITALVKPLEKRFR
jgi:hypothetical protein